MHFLFLCLLTLLTLTQSELLPFSTRNDIKGGPGFVCTPLTPPPQTKGPIEIPKILEFPPSIKIGGTITVTVNVSVDDVSSARREDFYLLSDATGSMTARIANVQKEFSKLVNARRRASRDVAFGVGYYRDEEEMPPFENLQGITTNLKKVKRGIDALEARGGLDFAEANLFALSQVAKRKDIGWRVGSRKILVYFGDAPGHEPTCPKGDDALLSGGRLTREKVIEDLGEKGIAVFATNFGGDGEGLDATTRGASGAKFGCPGNERTRARQGTDIAKGSLGALRLATDANELINTIIDGVGKLDQELSARTMDCAGKVSIRFNPILPISIKAGETRTIVEEVEILPGACEFPDGFMCEIELLLSGVGVKQVIQTTAIDGCVPDLF